jgi:anti-sigma regulatory factor (Ser/Thr protein kinase)
LRDSAPDLAAEIPLDAAALAAAQDRLAESLDLAGLPAPVRYRVRLVVEELVANLLMHGRFAGPPAPVRLALRLRADALLLDLDDAAAPFDPRTTPDPGLPDLADDRLGGLGLPLVRKMAEIRAYRRLPEGWNRTELAFALDAAAPG